MEDSKPEFLDYNEKSLLDEWHNRWVIDRLEKLKMNLEDCYQL
jgi:hypothetical protein